MYDKTIKELEARIKELETKCEEQDRFIESLRMELDSIAQDMVSEHKLARAICEIQEHLRDNDPNFFLINRIHAPTRVGQE